MLDAATWQHMVLMRCMVWHGMLGHPDAAAHVDCGECQRCDEAGSSCTRMMLMHCMCYPNEAHSGATAMWLLLKARCMVRLVLDART